MKRIIATLGILLILSPIALAQSTSQKAEDLTPSDIFLTVEFKLTGKIKEWLEPQIRQFLAAESDAPDTAQVIVDQLLAGERFFLSMPAPASLLDINSPEPPSFVMGLLISFPASSSQFDLMTKEFTKETYDTSTIFSDSYGETYMSHIGGLAVISPGKETIQKAIDRAAGKTNDSVRTNADYTKITDSFLADRMLGVVVDYEKVFSLFGGLGMGASTMTSELAGSGIEAFQKLFDLFKLEGFSVGKTAHGYEFTVNIIGDREKITAEGFSLTPSGTFTPKLYAQFPGGRPLFYTETFNAAQSQFQSDKLMQSLLKDAGSEELGSLYTELYITDMIKTQTGIDLTTFNTLFTKESAMAVQYTNGSILPSLTFLGNVSDTRSAALKFSNTLAAQIETYMKKSGLTKDAYSVQPFTYGSGTFNRISINLPTLADLTGDLVGALPEKVDLTIGVTGENLFIISTHTGIENPLIRTGFADDAEFASYPTARQPNAGVFYLNARSLWRFMDEFISWAEKNDPNWYDSLNFYKEYYGFLSNVYSLRDFMMVMQGTDFESSGHGYITIDEEIHHPTYEEFLSAFKEKDQDDDGVSDYKELYVYGTPVLTKDSDNDGLSDIHELKKGFNPKGPGRIFTDVPEGAFYTEDVAVLYQKGAIKGYSDKSYRPDTVVSRAEFTTMVINGLSSEDDNWSYDPYFSDVGQGDWYYEPVKKAYTKGFVKGDYEMATGVSQFRPMDSITRAEAMTILNRASKTLSKTMYENYESCVEHPFGDVQPNDWFCPAVVNGYNAGIARGKTPTAFRPNDTLNRAEAAALIRRAMQKDLETADMADEPGFISDLRTGILDF